MTRTNTSSGRDEENSILGRVSGMNAFSGYSFLPVFVFLSVRNIGGPGGEEEAKAGNGSSFYSNSSYVAAYIRPGSVSAGHAGGRHRGSAWRRPSDCAGVLLLLRLFAAAEARIESGEDVERRPADKAAFARSTRSTRPLTCNG